MTEETQKKLYIGGLIFLVIAGTLFVLWAMFFNRGTLTVEGKAPFIINISGVRTESCASSPCSTVLAPGDYNVSVQKTGYRTVSMDVNIPIGGEHREEVAFEFIPVIAKRGVEADLQLFAKPEINVPELDEDVPLFQEESYVAYLAYDSETKRQTLYVRGIANGELSEPRVAASFIRRIDDYTIIPAVDAYNAVALIDRGDEESTLYLVDLSAKTRNNVLELLFIEDATWITATKLLVEGQENGDIGATLFVHDVENKETTKLTLKAPLDNVAVVSEDRLIAATTQTFVGVGPSDQLGGELITLEELAATPDTTLNGPQLSFIEYDFATDQARLIALEPSITGADQIRLEPDGKSLLFLTNGEVYELTFAE